MMQIIPQYFKKSSLNCFLNWESEENTQVGNLIIKERLKSKNQYFWVTYSGPENESSDNRYITKLGVKSCQMFAVLKKQLVFILLSY